MPQPHIIRLRGPWHFRQTDSLGEKFGTTITLPISWAELARDYSGQLFFQRGFNHPTGLIPGQKVFLVITNAHLQDAIFNDQQLSLDQQGDGTSRWDISSQLQRRNEVRLVLLLKEQRDSDSQNPESPGGLEVWLEIEEPHGSRPSLAGVQHRN